MKVCLVSPPFSPPDHVTLGLPYLKSYVERHIAGTQVKIIDLNLRFFQRLFRGGTRLDCLSCPSDNIYCLPPDILLSGNGLATAARALKKKIVTRRDAQQYVDTVRLVYKHGEMLESCYNEHLKQYLKSGIPGELLSADFTDDAGLIVSGQPDILGFSVHSSKNFLYAAALARFIRKNGSAIPLMMGGPFISRLDAREVLKVLPCIDFVFQGEAEKGLAAFVRHYADRSWQQVPGMAYRSGGAVRINGRESITDLDRIPLPDFSDHDLTSYFIPEPVLPVLSARECYWKKCAFCERLSSPHAYRRRSIGSIVGELEEQHARYGVKNFFFSDDAISPSQLSALGREIRKRDLAVRYGVYLRPGKGVSYRLLKEAQASGLRWVFLGAETISPRLLKKIRKGTTAEKIREIAGHCRKLGLFAHIAYILGLPTQTEEELEREIAFIRDNDNVFLTRFLLCNDSYMFNNPEEFGITAGPFRVLLETNEGVVHHPWADYTAREGIAPERIDGIVAELADRIPYCGVTSELVLGAKRFLPRKSSLSGIVKRSVDATRRQRQKISARSPWHRYLAGRAGMLKRHFDDALESFRKIPLTGRPRFDQKVLFHTARCFLKQHEYDRAIEIFSHLKKLRPENKEIPFLLAECFKKRGEKSKSERELREAYTKAKNSSS